MALRHALAFDPIAVDDPRSDLAGTMRSFDPRSPIVQIGDLSAQRGDGVFESLGMVGRHAQEVSAHLARLAHSAALCDLPEPNLAQWREAISRVVVHAPETGESVLKLILSRGVDGAGAPTAWVTLADAPDSTAAREHGIRVVTLDRGYTADVPERAPWLLLGAKTLSYAVNMAAIREARRRGADDAVFLSSDGYVLEAPTASVILRRDGRYLTPEPAAGILHGTTQRSIFSYLGSLGVDTAYARITRDELRSADAAWVVSSIRLAAPIVQIDGEETARDAAMTASLNRYLLSPRD
ncbi:aminodeoxychorismate lyase [Microbacterium chocolatum]|uniref:aminodeoxychorismate lyase n=1 Tax=Microbacterium aurantiacum TaxID=162393 RepID=UPI00338DC1BE